jgi:hypothetical protein
MKTAIAIFCLLVLSSAASAQSSDASKWMCRNLGDSGGFTYQGETIFGTQACRPIPQAAPLQAIVAPTVAPQQAPAVAAPVLPSDPSNSNVSKNVVINAPTAATVKSPCLIVSGEQHRVNAASGAAGFIAFAASKGQWQYIDSYNMPSQFIETKYKAKEMTAMLQAGVHVIVTHSPDEVKDGRLSCQGLVSQK